MEIDKSIFLVMSFLAFNLMSCQTNKIISFNKYEDLGVERKKNVDENLADILKHLAKKENEIVLLFQYNCFFNKKLDINEKYNLDFPIDPNEDSYGQKFKKVKKEEGIIK